MHMILCVALQVSVFGNFEMAQLESFGVDCRLIIIIEYNKTITNLCTKLEDTEILMHNRLYKYCHCLNK